MLLLSEMSRNTLIGHGLIHIFSPSRECHWLSQSCSESTYLLLASCTPSFSAGLLFRFCILQCVECLTCSPKCLMSRNLSKVNLTLCFPVFTEDPITLCLWGEFHSLCKEVEPFEMFMVLDCLFYYGTLYERFEQVLLCSSFSTIVYFKERVPRPTIYCILDHNASLRPSLRKRTAAYLLFFFFKLPSNSIFNCFLILSLCRPLF